ncbi:MAG: 4Fe-4S dicluster domain-containing protein [Candidatus Lokiarchaeota archaeon]|nr:4Fe-4S dicluster domain-containing protein [Candidatus Lokiarchaeota archaeon]
MVDFEFRNELIKEEFSLNYCYQCGTCSSSCPVAFITEGEYNPRKIIEQSLLGLKDLLIKDQKPNVWLCCTCQMCVEECPQNVFLTEIFERIKNKIVLAGEPYPETFKTQAKSVIENGLAIPITHSIIRRRDQLELPKVESANIDEIKKLLDATNFKKKIKLVEENK